MEPRQAAPPGTLVYGADGEPFGTIRSSEDTYFVVDTGQIPPAYYVPSSAIVETRDDGIYLSATREDAERQGWGEAPVTEELSEAASAIEPASDYSAIQGEDSLDEDPMPTPSEGGGSTTGGRRTGAVNDLQRPSGATGPETTG
jgi:hypothetical protein